VTLDLAKFLDDRTEYKDLSLRMVREGKTEIFVPDPASYVMDKTEYLPTSLPVFYNPVMEINRDITILAVRVYLDLFPYDGPVYYVESMAGTGIRGFRLLNEVGDDRLVVIMNDIDPKAVDLIKFNAEKLDFPSDRLQIYNFDANYLFLELRRRGLVPSIIEIDPYGTPAPFVFNAIRALKGKHGLLITTATDTAPLTGKFPKAALRKYGCNLVKNPFGKEAAVRALLYMVGREATIVSKRIMPLFGFFIHHFIKIAVLVNRGRRQADMFWRSIGWVSFCPVCNEFYLTKGLGNFPQSVCDIPDHGRTDILGPIWVDPIFNIDFSRKMLEILDKSDNFEQGEKLKKIINWEIALADVPFFYDVQEIARRLHISAPGVNEVVDKLIDLGYRATRTHFNPRGVRTNAKIRDVVKIVKNIMLSRN